MTSFMLAALAAPREGGNTTIVFVIQMAAIFAIFYFLLIRPQRKAQKEHKEMVAALKRGDAVMTEGGIIGSVIHLKENEITIKTADETRLVVARQKIGRVIKNESAEAE